MQVKNHHKKPSHLSLITLALCSAVALSACNDDDDDNNNSIVSKSIGYNAPIAGAPVLPEGLAYDAARDAFLVSSATTGAIGQVDRSGNYTGLIGAASFGGNGSFGIEVDAAHNRLLVASANLADPTYGHLLIFNLETLALVHNVDLAMLNGGLSFVNDVAVDADGNAYVTNSDQGIIYKVDMAGQAEIFVQNDTLAPEDAANETGLNGIAYHPDGFLVVSHFVTSTLYKVSMDATPTVTAISLPQEKLIEADGIELDGNTLYAVNNGNLGGFVSRFSMNSDWTSGTADGDTYATGSIFPTTLAKTDDGLFVNNSYFNFPAYANNPADYLISEVSFDQNQRYSGSASEIPRINTPIAPLGYGTNYPSPLLAHCTDALGAGVPDLRGDWVEMDVTVNGETFSASQDSPYQERIEQCGERLIVVSSGVIHDLYKADGTMYNGVNDVNPQGQPVHSTGSFTADSLVLKPILPTAANATLPDVTRALVTDDSGTQVLRFFNAGLGRVIYMKR